MRAVVLLVIATSPVFVAACALSGSLQPALQIVTTDSANGLILQKGEGERRIRRPRPGHAGRVAAAGMTIKIDQQNGGSPNFFMGYEEILPGDAITPHMHPGYDEILFVHRGQGFARLGSRQAVVSEGATIYIPANTRVSLENTGSEPLSIVFLFPRPEMVSAYYRELTVAEGERAVPFSAEEFAAFRARHRSHVTFE